MKKIVVVALFCFLACVFTVPQDVKSQTGQSNAAAVLNDFSRASVMDGITFKFVLLNDKTLPLIFSGAGTPATDSIKAKASEGTSFFVIGKSDKNTTLDNRFSVEQDGLILTCVAVDIQNFGGPIEKGQTIKGVIQVEKKLNLSRPFAIKSSQNKLTFQLTPEALKQL